MIHGIEVVGDRRTYQRRPPGMASPGLGFAFLIPLIAAAIPAVGGLISGENARATEAERAKQAAAAAEIARTTAVQKQQLIYVGGGVAALGLLIYALK